MAKRARRSIYFDPDVLALLAHVAEETGKNNSQIVNDAIRAEYVWRDQFKKTLNDALKTHQDDVFSRVTYAFEEHRKGTVAILDDLHIEQSELIRSGNEEIIKTLKSMGPRPIIKDKHGVLPEKATDDLGLRTECTSWKKSDGAKLAPKIYKYD